MVMNAVPVAVSMLPPWRDADRYCRKCLPAIVSHLLHYSSRSMSQYIDITYIVYIINNRL